jgi:hypothetical protein
MRDIFNTELYLTIPTCFDTSMHLHHQGVFLLHKSYIFLYQFYIIVAVNNYCLLSIYNFETAIRL